jgi:hypothetical protein
VRQPESSQVLSAKYLMVFATPNTPAGNKMVSSRGG